MAINKETSFSADETVRDGSIGSIRSARTERAQYIKELRTLGDDSLVELEKQIKAIDKINLGRQEEQKKLADALLLYKELSNYEIKRDLDYEEYLKKKQKAIKMTKDLTDIEYIASIKTAKKIEDAEEREARLNALRDERNDRQVEYNRLLDQTNDMLETQKEASKSVLNSMADGVSKFRSEIKDLAILKGIGDISQGIFDKNNSSSMYNVYKNTTASLGISNSEFNRFKNDLTMQLAKSDNFFNFGWKDTADYLNRLGDLNITSQEMAEEQYLAVIQGTKYLGLQTETQAKILKLSRDTGRMDLLQQTNETMVQIMNAQLGISKEQLNKFTENAVEIADIATFLGGDGSAAMKQLETIQAAITKEYGLATSNAATDILKQILASPTGNKYYQSGFFGGEYNNILGDIQNNRYDNAMKRIIQSVKSSRSLEVARGDSIAMEALGVDNNIMAIGNSSGTMSGVNNNLNAINTSSNDILTTLKKFNQDWSDKIINAGSSILSLLPFSDVLSLQNVYYGLAITELVLRLPAKLNVITALLTSIAKSSSINATLADDKVSWLAKLLGKGGESSGLLGMVGKALPFIAGIAGTIMAIKDGVAGSKKADEWGTGKVEATIGGVLGGTDENTGIRTLKNVAKYAGIGAAIGTVFPGIGTAVGAFVGGALGLVGGLIGGKNIATGISTITGNKTSEGMGAPVSTPSPHYNTGGMGAASDSLPWSITSPFGSRTLPNGDSSYHNGVDFGIAEGTSIGAPVSGVVTSATIDNRNTYPSGPVGAGSGIYIQGDDGMIYQFWHLSQVGVQKGQRVKAGELIGLSGNTGYSTGAHLHFGAKKNGSWVNPLGYVTSGLFSPSGVKYSKYDSKIDPDMALNESKKGETLLESVISADTLSNQAKSVSYGQGAGNDEVVSAINGGFYGLNAKLEELSNRQNTQEEVLRQLTSGRNSKITGY